jgi:hypothetical protein
MATSVIESYSLVLLKNNIQFQLGKLKKDEENIFRKLFPKIIARVEMENDNE